MRLRGRAYKVCLPIFLLEKISNFPNRHTMHGKGEPPSCVIPITQQGGACPLLVVLLLFYEGDASPSCRVAILTKQGGYCPCPLCSHFLFWHDEEGYSPSCRVLATSTRWGGLVPFLSCSHILFDTMRRGIPLLIPHCVLVSFLMQWGGECPVT